MNPERKYSAGDLRRAGSLIRWHGEENVEGMTALIEEAVDVDRVPALLQAVCVIYQCCAEYLMTRVGLYSIGSQIKAWTEHDNPEIRTTASWVWAAMTRDVDTMVSIYNKSFDDRTVVALTKAILRMNAQMFPAVITAFGIERMGHLIERLAMRENGLIPIEEFDPQGDDKPEETGGDDQ